MKIVINTSSSLFFTKIGLVPYLLKNFELVASQEIFEEIKEGGQLGFKDAKLILQYFDDKKVKVIKPKKTHEIAKEFSIKETDASVIALAKELDCFVATEDKQIEKICLLLQTRVTNSALLIYLLWQKKEFDDSLAFLLLDLLVRYGYNKEICLKMKEKIMRGGKNL